MIFDLTAYDHPPYTLTAREARWLEQARTNAELQAADNDRRRLISTGKKINRAAERWTVATVRLASALANATVTSPPQKPPRLGRSSSDISDPTAAQIASTWATVDNACLTWAHLIGPCTPDPCHVCDRNLDSLTSLYDRLGIDLQATNIIDALLGTPSSSRQAFLDVLFLAEQTATRWAKDLAELWHDFRRGGLDDDLLTRVADDYASLAGRADGLVGSVSQWIDGTTVRMCSAPGCRAPAPPVGEGATCGACRTAKWRQGKAAS